MQAPPEAGTSRKSPMAEGIRKPLDDETVVSLWKSLSAEGNGDWRIANIIAKEHNLSPRSVEGKIRRLRGTGEIGENPNRKKRFRASEFIMGSRESLMARGMCDGKIAAEIAELTGAGIASLKTTISAMVRAGKIPPNPNNQVTAESEEFRWIRQRRKELQKLGLTDTSVSRVLACESEIRNAEAIRRIVWEMVSDKLLAKNEKEGWKEMEEIIVRRYELMAQGMDERDIAAAIGGEREMNPRVVGIMIYRAVNMGGCKENPN